MTVATWPKVKTARRPSQFLRLERFKQNHDLFKNIQHSTFNFQGRSIDFFLRLWVLNVECFRLLEAMTFLKMLQGQTFRGGGVEDEFTIGVKLQHGSGHIRGHCTSECGTFTLRCLQRKSNLFSYFRAEAFNCIFAIMKLSAELW
jgi:hypothetical protein